MAIWLLGPDPNNQCCGCEGKTSPCDSCGSDCCYVYPSQHFTDFATAKDFVTNCVGGCYSYATYIGHSPFTRNTLEGTLTNGVLAGSTSLASDFDTLGIGDTLGTAFALNNGQTANITYSLSSTPDIPSAFYGYEVYLFSGGGLAANTIVYSTAGLGSASNNFSYTASGDGCFYLFTSMSNSMISPSQPATTSILFSVSPNIIASPVQAGYGTPAAYTGKYGCTGCDPTAAELP